jgi:glucose-1-phosphate cytidylyltransferase
MKAVILAGGFGTRLSEETDLIPKPMSMIGQRPILWHILKLYSHYGVNDFVICCGYKGHIIKEYFSNYFLLTSDVTFGMAENQMDVHQKRAEPWTVTLVDTGEHTMTGGRIKRIEPYVRDDELFCLTYGDGLCDINITQLVAYHNKQQSLATVTAVYPPSRFGALDILDGKVCAFEEKREKQNLVNGGFFVLSPKVIDFIDDDLSIWEQEPMETLANNGEMSAFVHEGFWHPMDTLRDKKYLEELWSSGRAPWKLW